MSMENASQDMPVALFKVSGYQPDPSGLQVTQEKKSQHRRDEETKCSLLAVWSDQEFLTWVNDLFSGYVVEAT